VESALFTCVVDAEEGRDVALRDMPNAFTQTRVEDAKDMAFIKIRGVLINALVDVAPDVCKACITKDKKGVAQLLAQCQNAVHGTMVASSPCHRKFAKSLTSIGFVIDPCDPCVANKMVRGEQIAICWHVDDLKVSHVMPKVMDRMIKCPRKECESTFEDGSGAMEVSCGKTHKCLRMTLDCNVRGQVSVTAFDHLDNTLTVFEKVEPNGGGTKTSAAPTNLFTVNKDCEKLPDGEAVEFHNVIAKTLHVTERARPDTCTPFAFLTTRVQEPNTNDWKKMAHLMRHVRGTCDMPLILSANGSHTLKWWVDASFAVRPNLRGHTGGGLSLGRGFPVVSATKQKLNAQSSTESELAGADAFMPAKRWTRCFVGSPRLSNQGQCLMSRQQEFHPVVEKW
jgi:hypothetical protein